MIITLEIPDEKIIKFILSKSFVNSIDRQTLPSPLGNGGKEEFYEPFEKETLKLLTEKLYLTSHKNGLSTKEICKLLNITSMSFYSLSFLLRKLGFTPKRVRRFRNAENRSTKDPAYVFNCNIK